MAKKAASGRLRACRGRSGAERVGAGSGEKRQEQLGGAGRAKNSSRLSLIHPGLPGLLPGSLLPPGYRSL